MPDDRVCCHRCHTPLHYGGEVCPVCGPDDDGPDDADR